MRNKPTINDKANRADVLAVMAGPCGRCTVTEIASKLHLPRSVASRVARQLEGEGVLLNVTRPRERVARYIHRDWSIEVSRAYVVQRAGEDGARRDWPHLWRDGA